ncbi:GrpB family protein [Sporosarcina sp. Marseille-Q4063]|uniref:GrpB family protein n=1 Tax=Sporosarcina sp. Marseille-Q4063 TaxID=2810514 RepID=UPI001BB0B250|nr:GrpB family protein [Sporosarcina sp. Marseille-Q4063]QUW23163.1 GrpB family protein [Sporosarcina sp. Marseille-Q4063]
MEQVSFYNQKCFKRDVEKTFTSHRDLIQELIPRADVQHVGSTAIPNSLTKGDLDIQVRVSKIQFIQAVESLSSVYESNDESIKTSEFRAFKDDTGIPPLGIQLTIIGSEFDFFWKFRDILLQNDQYRTEYDELKRKFEGKCMEAYRGAKNDFFSKIIQTPEFKRLKTDINRND